MAQNLVLPALPNNNYNYNNRNNTLALPSNVQLSLNLQGVEDAFNEKVALFTNYLDRDFKENEDQENIKSMIEKNEKRLIIDIDELRNFDPELCENLFKHPADYLPAFEKALKDIILATFRLTKRHVMQDHRFYIGFKGPFGQYQVNPRSLNASYLNQLIALDGIVTRCSLVRPKMVRSVHYCEQTQLFHTKDYRDASMLGESIPTGTTYLTEDEHGNPLTTEFGYSTFLDHQWISIQEMPEKAPPGQLPRSIDVLLGADLVDQCKPGDRIHVVGVYRSLGQGVMTGTFRTFLLCSSVTLIDTSVSSPWLSDQDVLAIRKMAQRSSIVDSLAQSLAPSIFGHVYIKKALVLLLLGGLERNLENGTHLRGDINILLLGDPSTAKSQFLRFVLQVAPLAIATTGRGSSGVGLTAAVTTDPDTGDRRLEAGAMVLADRGIVCIDEFDKMNDTDRVAIHEVMEQQTITIAKAGIHTSLNARCSVVAAANPTYGQYDETLEPHRNIRLPDSLLSRFDLLFLVLDKTDERMDRQLSTHVLQMHRSAPSFSSSSSSSSSSYTTNTNNNMNATSSLHDQGSLGLFPDPFTPSSSSFLIDPPSSSSDSFPNDTVPSSSSSSNSHTNTIFAKRGKKRKDDVFTLSFLKKYLHFAKTRIKPVLSQEASEVIVEEYANLRNERQQESNTRRTLPITARTLETLIRLSTAHAKARLSNRVEPLDAEAAAELLRFALFKEYHKKKKSTSNVTKKLKRMNLGLSMSKPHGSDPNDVSGSSSEEEEEDEQEPKNAMETSTSLPASSQSQMKAEISLSSSSSDARYDAFKQCLHVVFQEVNELQLHQIASLVNQVHLTQMKSSSTLSSHPLTLFSEQEVQVFLDQLETDLGVYIDKETGVVYRM